MESKFEPVMSGQPAATVPPVVETTAVDSSRVLRNTYWLLALSLLPTIAGAFAGMQFNFIALLQGGADHDAAADARRDDGSLFVVTLLRNSAMGFPRCSDSRSLRG